MTGSPTPGSATARRTALPGRRCAALVVAMTALATAGCGIPQRALVTSEEPASAASTWPMVLIAAQSDVDQARHADAERRLREFATEYPRSAEAHESTYWRAVFMLDPGNTTATPRDAAALLDRYLGATSPLVHRAEAMVLQRLARSLAAPREGAPARAPDAARDAELKALKDELEQTKAELERIRKRVAPPPTTTTPPPLPDAE